METDWAAEERVPIHKMLTPADVVSLTNGLLGLLAIVAAANGQARLAFSFIVFAILVDGVDGGVARLGYGGGRLGSKLDSFSDLVSFVAAPAFLFWTLSANRAYLPISTFLPDLFLDRFLILAVCGLYFVTGMLRLARFDYLKGGERHDYFVGVTTPGAASVIASVSLLRWEVLPSLFTIAVCALLMTSRVRLPKVRRSLTGPAILVLLTAVILGDAFNMLGPVLLLTSFLVYLILGPGYVRRHSDPDEAPLPY